MNKINFLQEGKNLSYEVVEPDFERAEFVLDIDYAPQTRRLIPFGLPKKVTYCDFDCVDLSLPYNFHRKQEFFRKLYQNLLDSISREVDSKTSVTVLIDFDFVAIHETVNAFSWNKIYTLNYVYIIPIDFPVDMNKLKVR